MEEIILKKVSELAEEAKALSQPNSAIVLFALAGSIQGEVDGLLAKKVQEFTKDVLMPNIESKMAFIRISNN